MSKSAAWKFPFEFDIHFNMLRRATTVNDTISSAIKAFLLTVPGSRRGNMIGSIVPSLKHQLIPSTALPAVEEDIKQELIEQFPGVIFTQVKLEQKIADEVVTLILRIQFTTPISDIEEIQLLV